jgi:hypothetical protein
MKKRGRGRPVKCNHEQKRHVAALVRKHGLQGAMAVLKGEAESFNPQVTAKLLAGCTLTMPTIRKYATAYGVPALKRGRKPGSKNVEAPVELKKAA